MKNSFPTPNSKRDRLPTRLLTKLPTMLLGPLFFVMACGPVAVANEQEAPALGAVDFPTSGSAEAQPLFERGVLLLHSFEYEDAAIAFREAQEIDPSFVMAYWGEAHTYNHPMWMQQDRDAALAAILKIGPDPKARQAAAQTQIEKDWIATLDILYGEGEKQDRDDRYSDSMRRLAEKYPDDHEVTTFYALSVMGTAHEGREFDIYMKAASIALPVIEANPEHPGAAHYTIHAFDDPVHAPLGLPAAIAYSSIAPDAGHAQHMTSHIFVAMGMWDDVIAANIRARDVQNSGLARKNRRPNVCGHYTSWLHYGYLQKGQHEVANAGMAECHERMSQEPRADEAGYFASMRARAVLDGIDPGAADRWTADLSAFPGAAFSYDVISALSAVQAGDVDDAMASRNDLASRANNPRAQVMMDILDGFLAAASGDSEKALAHLKSAAKAEEALPYAFGPPATLAPPHEMLGNVLVEYEYWEEAKAAYQEQLSRTPLRTTALQGLAKTALALGDSAMAEEIAATLENIWRDAPSAGSEE